MYAVFKLSGFQYRAEEGQVIEVPRQSLENGSKLEISDVMLVNTGDSSLIGTPLVEGARIQAEVLGQNKGEKVLVYKYKRRTKYRRTQGHRQNYTSIRINKIVAP